MSSVSSLDSYYLSKISLQLRNYRQYTTVTFCNYFNYTVNKAELEYPVFLSDFSKGCNDLGSIYCTVVAKYILFI